MKHEKRPVALITGSSSGIGAAYSRELARQGYYCIIVARNRKRLDGLAVELKREFGIGATVLAADLSTADGIARVERHIAGEKNLEILVNSAGFGTRGSFADVDKKKIADMVALHTAAPARLARAALPAMLVRGRGAIVNVSSLASFFTSTHYVAYSATKAFLNMLSLGLAAELKGTGVKVQAICPGLTRTGFLDTDEYADFDYSDVPSWAWMSPEGVVRISLKALDGRKVIVVPGLMNRMFVATMKTPLLGSFIRWAIDLLSGP